MNTRDEKQLAAYRETMGREAAERQQKLAEEFCPACGWRRVKGHHPLCPTRKAT